MIDWWSFLLPINNNKKYIYDHGHCSDQVLMNHWNISKHFRFLKAIIISDAGDLMDESNTIH